jgi:hypothetical protein
MVKRAKQLQEKGPKAKQQKKEETFNDKLNSRDAYQSPKKIPVYKQKEEKPEEKKADDSGLSLVAEIYRLIKVSI